MRNAAEGESSAAIAERVVDTESGDAWNLLTRVWQKLCIALVDAGRAASWTDHHKAVPRLRAVCQTLVAEVGASGPCDAEDAAARAVTVIRELRAAASSPRTIPPLTDKEAAVLWEEAPSVVGGVRAGYNLAASRLGATVAAPAPAPEPPSVTVNGWRVTYHKGEKFEYVATRGSCEHLYLNAVRLCEAKSMTDDADLDVVRVLALREGRGDDA